MIVDALKSAGWSLKQNPLTTFAFVGFGLFVFVALFSPLLVHYNPTQSDFRNALQPPSFEHWAGTDQLGRDVFSRIIAATRLDLMIAFLAVSLSAVVGTVFGGISGYVGGRVDLWTSRTVDVLMAFPLFIVAMAIVAALGNEIQNIIYATALINLPFYIRFARAEVNIKRSEGWIEAARLSGNSHVSVIFRFLLPNILPTLSIQASLNLGWAILNCAGLSFIGLGIQPPTPEWGIMVAEGAGYLARGSWWLIAFPGLALALSVLFFNLVGDGLRDILDPRERT